MEHGLAVKIRIIDRATRLDSPSFLILINRNKRLSCHVDHVDHVSWNAEITVNVVILSQ